jgi:hypothetical protein
VIDLKKYFVFMCSKCKHFTLAPTNQKSRRCSYCGSIINIEKATKALFDSPDQATEAVKQFNAKGSDDFEKAVERSRERIRSLVPRERIEIKSFETGSELPPGKTKRLMKLLEVEAKEDSISLGKIESLCEQYQLEWSWVEMQLTKLSNAGVIIFPKPWTVKLVPTTESNLEEKKRQVDVSKDIILILQKHRKEMTLQEFVDIFNQKGVSKISVESSLAKLLRDGEIYEPRPNTIALV